MCASVFLDIQRAFVKVWHQGLLYKLKKTVPSQIYLLLKSYLTGRHFQVNIENTHSGYYPINSGVPQCSVLGPFLYLIFTSDIPQSQDITLATFADDTAILSSHINPNRISENLQKYLNVLQEWLRLWKIKVNNANNIHHKTECVPTNCNKQRTNPCSV
jgi:hypothetical protein